MCNKVFYLTIPKIAHLFKARPPPKMIQIKAANLCKVCHQETKLSLISLVLLSMEPSLKDKDKDRDRDKVKIKIKDKVVWDLHQTPQDNQAKWVPQVNKDHHPTKVGNKDPHQ